ncbi:MAG: M1 family peptidase, partial [Ilumatobacteraceae bacterium]
MPPETDNPYRLPRVVAPHRYTLALEPDLAAATFVGHVVIDATAAHPTDRIVLNALELDVQSVRVDGIERPFTLDERTERLHIDAVVPEGAVSLEISF